MRRMWRSSFLIALIFVPFLCLAESGSPSIIKPPFNLFVDQLEASATCLKLSPLGNDNEPLPEKISKAQALEDVQMLEYLFDAAYSGKAHWSRNGIDFPAMIKEARAWAETSENPLVPELEKIICDHLANIRDGHLGVSGRSRHRFFKHQDAWFADILVERKGESLFGSSGKWILLKKRSS